LSVSPAGRSAPERLEQVVAATGQSTFWLSARKAKPSKVMLIATDQDGTDPP
jgi:hypothetical protein